MTRVRLDLFVSLDGHTSTTGVGPDHPMGEDWGRLTSAYAATRTFHERLLGDARGTGTTGIDDFYAAAHLEGIGAEIMGAGMFGLHAFPDDPEWKGWWGGPGTRLWDDLGGLEITHHVTTEVAESGTTHVTFTRQQRP